MSEWGSPKQRSQQGGARAAAGGHRAGHGSPHQQKRRLDAESEQQFKERVQLEEMQQYAGMVSLYPPSRPAGGGAAAAPGLMDTSSDVGAYAAMRVSARNRETARELFKALDSDRNGYLEPDDFQYDGVWSFDAELRQLQPILGGGASEFNSLHTEMMFPRWGSKTEYNFEEFLAAFGNWVQRQPVQAQAQVLQLNRITIADMGQALEAGFNRQLEHHLTLWLQKARGRKGLCKTVYPSNETVLKICQVYHELDRLFGDGDGTISRSDGETAPGREDGQIFKMLEAAKIVTVEASKAGEVSAMEFMKGIVNMAKQAIYQHPGVESGPAQSFFDNLRLQADDAVQTVLEKVVQTTIRTVAEGASWNYGGAAAANLKDVAEIWLCSGMGMLSFAERNHVAVAGLFEALDGDGNKKLDANDFKNNPAEWQIVKVADEDGDGHVSLNELFYAFEKMVTGNTMGNSAVQLTRAELGAGQTLDMVIKCIDARYNDKLTAAIHAFAAQLNCKITIV